ncbi:PA0069 family radical SAM protein [Cesiribacter andamanensis]|uniref:Radical SAM superfamily protein n=1 Tax=Cesiribacter andamanensis AMV16 TaxID=1279009 RepID=M7NAP4_9BACT|nr:PA0069 family radical SAM protein [Cesiribacter andamanensis]EMR04322.1 Radical SAM superfamily protein [Cesiribacter andamanensis AMV16]
MKSTRKTTDKQAAPLQTPSGQGAPGQGAPGIGVAGRGAQSNPHNRFSRQGRGLLHLEGIDELPAARQPTQFFMDTPRQIVNKVDSPDLGMMQSVNPYQGCEHGCIYCYARNSHEYWGFSAGLDFESKIVVKKNAPELLEKQFASKAWTVAPIGLSGNTDCYQPAERQFGLTRRLLQTCLKWGNPVSIITKNSLILRDLDILKPLAEEGLLHVYLSLTTLQEELRRKMEPRTATAQRRLHTLQQLTEAGIPCGIMTAPIIPGLNSSEVWELVKAGAAHGALTAGYTVVRLNGQVGPIFKEWLHTHFPDRAAKVWNGICALHGGEVADSQWGRRINGEGQEAQAIRQLFRAAKQKFMAGRQMPAYRLDRFRPGGTLSLF